MWLAKSISVITVGQVSYTNLSFIQNRNFFQFKYSVVLSFLLGSVIISMKIIVQIKIFLYFLVLKNVKNNVMLGLSATTLEMFSKSRRDNNISLVMCLKV